MNEDKRRVYDLMNDYFQDCEEYGYSDFAVWCEDNLDTVNQESYAFEITESVNTIAGILFL